MSRPEVFEESSLLQIKVLAGSLTVKPRVAEFLRPVDVYPREIHQVAVPPGLHPITHWGRLWDYQIKLELFSVCVTPFSCYFPCLSDLLVWPFFIIYLFRAPVSSWRHWKLKLGHKHQHDPTKSSELLSNSFLCDFIRSIVETSANSLFQVSLIRCEFSVLIFLTLVTQSDQPNRKPSQSLMVTKLNLGHTYHYTGPGLTNLHHFFPLSTLCNKR